MCPVPPQGAARRQGSTVRWPARVGAPCSPPKALPRGQQGRDPSLAAVIITKSLSQISMHLSHLKVASDLATSCSSSTASPRAGARGEQDISLRPWEGMDLLLSALWGPQPHRALARAPLFPPMPSPRVSSCPSQGRGEGDPVDISWHPAAQHSPVAESPRPSPSQPLPLDCKASSSSSRTGLQSRAVPTGSLDL